VQIALDSARGLQYIHEHTVPVYIHRDIKSENILIDKKLCAKVRSVSITLGILLLLFYLGVLREILYCFLLQVADFGLTKLIDVGSSSLHTTNVKGTFGYMPPEYDELCSLF